MYSSGIKFYEFEATVVGMTPDVISKAKEIRGNLVITPSEGQHVVTGETSAIYERAAVGGLRSVLNSAVRLAGSSTPATITEITINRKTT